MCRLSILIVIMDGGDDYNSVGSVGWLLLLSWSKYDVCVCVCVCVYMYMHDRSVTIKG